MTRYLNPILASLFVASLASCDKPTVIHAPGLQARKGVVEVEPIEAGRVVAGQTIYVPAYPSIYTADRAENFQLAVTLSIRNTDQNRPIVITAARYYDSDGVLVREYVKKPLSIQPMAAMEFFVKESDTRGGVSASFLVDWVSDQSATAPVLESVMVGTLGTQGVSFISAGRVVSDRSRSRPDGE